MTNIVYKKEQDIASRLIDGEAVIVVPSVGEVKILNKTGSRMWELIDGKRSAAQIAELITAEFDISLDVAESDVKEFLLDLSQKSLVSKKED